MIDLLKRFYSGLRFGGVLSGLVVVFLCNVSSEPLVSTPLGDLLGYHMETRGGRLISAFTGIPYAVPPLDELRFKAAVPVAAWEGVYNATRQNPLCVQRNPYIRQKEIVGQEDCLYLNIYTPYTFNELDKDKLLPVMMFIHGGGWMCGDATTGMYGPEYILDRDVILVTTNYRLGPLGFLSTLDEHCPGNNGLKDQQEALRFIQKTIESFGGDKTSVTIFGESAGGASVHYHMLSPTSAGLFHKGISESGTALVPWAEAQPGEALAAALRLAALLGCPKAPSTKLLDCLRTKDSYDLIATEYDFYKWDYEPMTPFKAVAEPDLPGAFLTRSPRDTPQVPAVPWMTGLNKDEGCLKSVWITSNSTLYDEFVTGFDSISPVTFYYENSPYTHEITQTLRNKFNVHDVEDFKLRLPEMYTYSYFSYPAIEAVEETFKYTKEPIYLYELTYKATNSFSQIFGDPEGDYGVCHADELMHLFPIHFLSKPFSARDREVSDLIITLWTNFATTGNPNEPIKLPFKWEPATSGHRMEYLDIGDNPNMKQKLAQEARIWAELPLWQKIRAQRGHTEL